MAYKFQDGAAKLDGNITGSASITAGTEFVIGSAAIGETELEILDGATISTTELNYLNITALGTVDASAVVTSTAQKDISAGLRSLTASANVMAGYFQGDGSLLSNVSMGTTFTTLSGSGRLETVGATVLGNTLSVSGAADFASTVSGGAGTFTTLAGTSLALQGGGITAGGAIAGTTCDFSGLANLDGGIEIANGSNLFTVSAGGALSASLGITGSIALFGLPAVHFGVNPLGQMYHSNMAAIAPDMSADHFVILDNDTGDIKAEAISDLVSSMAGAGLTATNGVLKVDDLGTVTILEEGASATVVLLAEGVNAFSGAIGRDRTLSLPAPASPEAGDSITVKLNSFSTSGDTITITGSSKTGSIDGEKSVELESDYGAVTFVRLNTTGDWMIL